MHRLFFDRCKKLAATAEIRGYSDASRQACQGGCCLSDLSVARRATDSECEMTMGDQCKCERGLGEPKWGDACLHAVWRLCYRRLLLVSVPLIGLGRICRSSRASQHTMYSKRYRGFLRERFALAVNSACRLAREPRWHVLRFQKLTAYFARNSNGALVYSSLHILTSSDSHNRLGFALY